MLSNILRWLIRQLVKLLNILDPMSDLTKLSAQVDRAVTLEGQAASVVTTPVSDQPAIDDLTTKLTASNDALEAALTPPPAPAP
jgi:hypothetical protein